jgi:hypothetical protein
MAIHTTILIVGGHMARHLWLSLRTVDLSTVVAVAGSGTYVLNFVVQTNAQTNWVAEAVASSINGYFQGGGQSMSQCSIANSVFSLTTCCTSPVPAGCVANTTLTLCVQAASNYASGTGVTPSAQTVANAIAGNTPVGVTLVWNAGGNGYVAIYGYTSPTTGAFIYYVADPVNGYSLMNSTMFPSGYFGGATWNYTVYTQS